MKGALRMTKAELIELLEDLDDDAEVTAHDVREWEREAAEERELYIDELEERQHQSGFYAFQDRLEMYRRER